MGVLILGAILASGCTDKQYGKFFHSSSINIDLASNNLVLSDVGLLASSYYSVEEVIPSEGIIPGYLKILNVSGFGTDYTAYQIKILVPFDKKMNNDEYPEYLTFFIHQNDTDMGWNSLPRSNSNYPRDYVADMLKISFNISNEEAKGYAETFSEKVTYDTVSIPYQPDIGAIVDFMGKSGELITTPIGDGNYLIEFSNRSLPYEYQMNGIIWIHTSHLRITDITENATYVLIIDQLGNLNVYIKTYYDEVSLEDGKMVLMTMIENIGLNPLLIDELEFETIVT